MKFVVVGKLDKPKGEQVSTMDDYEANLRNAIRYFMHIAPDATLIFATTPVPKGEPGGQTLNQLTPQATSRLQGMTPTSPVSLFKTAYTRRM